MENKTETYEDKILSQTELLMKLAAAQKAAPSDDKKQKIVEENEVLRHFTNAAKGTPKNRAKNAYEFTRNGVLDQVIEPAPAGE